MATTSPDGIYSPDTSTNYYLTTHLAAMADSVQDALTERAGFWEVDTIAERNALVGVKSLPIVVIRGDAATGRTIEYTTDGTTWRAIGAIGIATPYATFADRKTISVSGASSATASVSFGGRFTVTPVIQVSVGGSGYIASYSDATSSGCTVRVEHKDGTTATLSREVSITAIQMTSSSATG